MGHPTPPPPPGEFPLAWERLRWSARPRWPERLARVRDRYYATDFRLVVRRGGRTIEEVGRHELSGVDGSRGGRRLRLRGGGNRTVTFHGLGHPDAVTLALELVGRQSDEPQGAPEWISTLLSGQAGRPFGTRARPRVRVGVAAAALTGAAGLVAFSLLGSPRAGSSAGRSDALYLDGVRRSREDIVAFMEREMMPVAQQVLAPIVGGADNVTCRTCHGTAAVADDWTMPAVRALPEPSLRGAGMERHASRIDAQMRNAVYGYLAEDRKQPRMAYMRDVVMPRVARVLGRPPYDFTQSYAYNRSRSAFGCYHCHRVSSSAPPSVARHPALLSPPGAPAGERGRPAASVTTGSRSRG